jgi:hypothetical protein
MTDTRYLLAAMPGGATFNAMHGVVAREALDALLGSTLFPPRNWHQSLSDRYWPDENAELEKRLLRACARVSAQRVTLLLNRIVRKGTHWAFCARGRPKSFDELLVAIRVALAIEGFDDKAGHTPHVTISYWAPVALPPLKISPPIPCVIDQILLLKSMGSGRDYHYEQVGPAWPLQRPSQLDLFEL